MYISEYAQSLLDSGRIEALQALSVEELLPQAINDEINIAFENPNAAVATGDSLPGSFIDCVNLESLKEACVVSSGHIYSRETIRSHIQDLGAAGKEVICPMSRRVLNPRLHSRQAYVLLPQIDELLNNFRSLLTQPSAPPLSEMAVGTLSLKTSNCVLTMVIELEPEYCSQFTGFLERRLPNSRVMHWSGSYLMNNHEAFGRCWKIEGSSTYEIDLWFPEKKKKTCPKKTFGNHDLNQLLKDFYQILDLPLAQTASSELNLKNIAAIPDEQYIIALEETPISEGKLVACCDQFLEKTQEIAQERGWPVQDVVMNSPEQANQWVTTGSALFVAGSATHTTTTLRPGNR